MRYRIVVGLILAHTLAVLPALSNFEPGIYSADLSWYQRAVQEMDRDYLFPARVSVQHDINEDPYDFNKLEHNVYVRGPKQVFFTMLWGVSKLLKLFSSAEPTGPAFSILAWTCLCLLLCLAVSEMSPQGRLDWIFLPVCGHLFLMFKLSAYYTVHTPGPVLLHVLMLYICFLLVVRSRSRVRVLIAGLILAATFGVSSSAPLYTFSFGLCAAAFWRFRKKLPMPEVLKSGALLILGFLAGGLILESIFRSAGHSFVHKFYLHITENIYHNHLGQPFPWRVTNILRLFLYIAPITILTLLSLSARQFWQLFRRKDFELLDCFLLFGATSLAALSFSPSIPLLRSVAPSVFFLLVAMIRLSHDALLGMSSPRKVQGILILVILAFYLGQEGGINEFYRLDLRRKENRQTPIDALEIERGLIHLLHPNIEDPSLCSRPFNPLRMPYLCQGN